MPDPLGSGEDFAHRIPPTLKGWALHHFGELYATLAQLVPLHWEYVRSVVQKGWRERKHRKHVGADYKHPFPKGQFDGLHKRSQDLMKRDPVSLTFEQRVEVCKAFYE